MKLSLAALMTTLALGGCSSPDFGVSCQTAADCTTSPCLKTKTLNKTTSKCEDRTGLPGTCSPPCATHADCKKLGATLRCSLSPVEAACNPTGVCLDNYKCTGDCREAPES